MHSDTTKNLADSCRLERALQLLMPLLAVAMFFGTFYTYAVNVPMTDDIYDALYWLYATENSDGLAQKTGMLFWQYDEYRLLLNKLVYSAYGIFGYPINFVVISLVGCFFLLITAWCTYLLFPENCRDRSVIALLIIATFNLTHHFSLFWPMSSLNAYGSLMLAALCLFLLSRKTHYSFMAACVSMFVLVLSMGNGLVIIPLGLIYLLCTPRSQCSRVTVWLAVGAVALFILFMDFKDYIPRLAIVDQAEGKGYLESIPLMIQGFLMLLGALPFEHQDNILLPLVLGIVVVALILYMIWQCLNERRLSYLPLVLMLVFCLGSLALCAVFRVPQHGIETVFESRYRINTCLVWGILIGYYRPVLKPRMVMASLMVFFAAVTFDGWRVMDSVYEWSERKKEDMSRWVMQGTFESLGLTGWFPLTHEIMVRALQEGYYDPFSNRGIDYVPEHWQLLAECPTISADVPVLYSGLVYSSKAVGAKIAFIDRDDRIRHVAFCADSMLVPVATLSDNNWVDRNISKKKLIIDTRKLNPGSYRALYLDDAMQVVAIANSNLVFSGWQPEFNCNEEQMDPLTVRRPMVKVICQPPRVASKLEG